ncbi:MAG: tripartite tricarboxylate transporter TctB family protein [Bacteroidota bacterium]
MDKRIAEAWVLGIISILAIYFLRITYQLPDVGGIGPRTFPAFIFWALLALNGVRAIALIRDFQQTKNKDKGKSTIWNFVPRIPRETLVSIGMIILYVILCKIVGFVIASSLYILSASWFLASGRKRSFVKYLTISVVFTLIVYLTFSWAFKINLPQGIWGGVL